MSAIEEIGEVISKAVSEAVKKAVVDVLKEVASKQKQARESSSRKAKPVSLRLYKTEFKVKESRYNNGSKIVIVEKEGQSLAFALNKEDWLKLREFLDGYFGIADNGNSSNGSQPAKKSYAKKSYSRKSNSKPAVKVVKGYSRALDEEEAD